MTARHRSRWATWTVALSASLWLAACGEGTVAPVDDPDPPAPPANQTPVAIVGADQVVSVGLEVSIEGSGTDADGDALSFTWSISSAPSGSATALTTTDTETASFTPDVAGDYVLQLIVNDGTDDSSASTATVTANDNTVTATISASAGGTITSADGRASLDVPAGALSADTEISMTPRLASQLPEYAEEFDPTSFFSYDMQPDGLMFSSPARLTVTVDDPTIIDEGRSGILFPWLFSVADGEADWLPNSRASFDIGDDEGTWSADVAHFSDLMGGFLVEGFVGATISGDAEVEQNVDFERRVYLNGRIVNGANPPTITAGGLTDRSGTYLTPDPGLETSLEATSQFYSSFHNYQCSRPGGARGFEYYGVTVSATIDASTYQPRNPLTVFGQMLSDPSKILNPTIDLGQYIECLAPPPPPPDPWQEVILGTTLESLAIVGAFSATMTIISAIGNVFIHSDVGAPVAPVAVPASVVNQAVFATAAAVGANGQGPLVAAGAEGTYVRTGAEAVMQMARVGRALDCFMQEVFNALMWACAGFENREIVFLESSNGSLPTVNEQLTDLFTPGGNSVFGTDRPVSVWFGPEGFTESSPLLIGTVTEDESDGHLYIASLVGGAVQLTRVDDIAWPGMRKVRCAIGLTYCAISAFGNLTGGIGNMIPFTWDGSAAVRVFGGPFTAVGKLIGIDVQPSNGNALVVTTDFQGNGFQNNLRVEEWTPAGDGWLFNRLAQVAVPFACKNPTVGLLRPNVPDLNEVLVACAGDNSNNGRIVSVTYEFPET